MKTQILKHVCLAGIFVGGIGTPVIRAQSIETENVVKIKMVENEDGKITTVEKEFNLNSAEGQAAYATFLEENPLPKIHITATPEIHLNQEGEDSIRVSFETHEKALEIHLEAGTFDIPDSETEEVREISIEIIDSTLDGEKNALQKITTQHTVVIRILRIEEVEETEAKKMQPAETERESSIQLQPAGAEGFSFQATLPGTGNARAELLNMEGKVMQEIPVNQDQSGCNGAFSIAGFPSGIYFLRVVRNGKFDVKKIFVQE